MTKWPWVRRKILNEAVEANKDQYERGWMEAQVHLGNQVRQWAVDANYNVYNADTNRQGALALAAFQDAIGRFSTSLVHRGRKTSELAQ